MTHRGPDEEGYLRDSGIALGMRRLSIIDLVGSHQPVSNEDGTIHTVFNEYVDKGVLKDPSLAAFFQPPDTVSTTHILKDASDSAGVLGALNRVYLNIGLFSEEWLLHFNPFFGGKPISPIEISAAEENSEYWKATEAQTPYMALFLAKAGVPDPLRDAPGGDRHLSSDPAPRP